MRNRRLVKFQLFLLVAALGLIIWRVNTSFHKGDGFISRTQMSVSELYSDHFASSDSVMILIEANVAFESEDLTSPMAVYPWIIDRKTRRVIWDAVSSDVIRDGVLAEVKDSIMIPPGEYTVYFTTLGPTPESDEGGSFLGLKPYWTNDPDFWTLSLKESGASNLVRLIDPGPDGKPIRGGESMIWAFTPDRMYKEEGMVFRVSQDVQLNVDATAAICDLNCDAIRILRVPGYDRFWQLEESMTTPAGGAEINRTFQGTLDLPVGIYRFEYSTGNKQVKGSWNANPPWLPDSWGTQFTTMDPSSIAAFDPWTYQEPMISMLQIGDDMEVSKKVILSQPLSVIVFGVGELGTGDTRYDYGWIEKEGQYDKIWEMTYATSVHAGGDDMNREEMAIVTLEAGTYYVKYVSDGSHSYDGWNKSSPTNPERWGIAVFPLEPNDPALATVQIVDDSRVPSAPPIIDPSANVVTGSLIVQKNRLGNDAHIEEFFELVTETRLKIVALGEMTSSSNYDYGWIEDVSNGRNVWQMTHQNTISGGGADRNRRFSGIITLGPGQYKVFFETDFSHSYGNFDDDVPVNSEDWGISIYEVAE